MIIKNDKKYLLLSEVVFNSEVKVKIVKVISRSDFESG
jgi:hypothetical protein